MGNDMVVAIQGTVDIKADWVSRYWPEFAVKGKRTSRGASRRRSAFRPSRGQSQQESRQPHVVQR
jgi:hypothetical protein